MYCAACTCSSQELVLSIALKTREVEIVKLHVHV